MKKLTTLVISLTLAMTFAGCATRENDVTSQKVTNVKAVATASENEPVSKEETATTEDETTAEETTAEETTVEETTVEETKVVEEEKTTEVEKTEEPEIEETKYEPAKKKRVVLYVDNIQQCPELPMGCEAVSGSIALQFYGFDVDKFSLLDYQPMMEEPDEDGNWGDPWKVFVGDPSTFKYGCYSPVIKKAIEDYWKDNKVKGYEVVDLGGSELTDLYAEIDAGNPLIIWVSTGMQDIETDKVSWTLKEDGSTFHWTLHEHCVCLIGYDTEKDTVIISDPYDSRGTVEYPRDVVEDVFQQMFNQALVIHEK